MVKAIYVVATLALFAGFFLSAFAYTGIDDRRKRGKRDEALQHPFRYALSSLWRPVIPQKLRSTFNCLRRGLIIMSLSLLTIVIVGLIELLQK